MLTFVLATTPAAAQTLAQALEQAWLLHPQAQAGSARNAQAAARVEAASGLTPGPATLSLGSASDRFHANQGQREWEVEMAVPLWLPGQKAAQGAEAASGQAQVVAQQHALRLQLAGELRTAWWTVAAARQTRTQAQQRVDTAQALLANVQRRYRTGELARIDANLAQREVLAAQGALADSDAALLLAEQSFHALTGTAAPQQLDPEPPAVRDAPGQEHPLRAAASATLAQAQARVRSADTTRRASPELALRMVRDRGAAGQPYANTLGVKLTIPLSSEPLVRQAQSAALAELAQAQAEIDQVERTLALDAALARRHLETTERQWKQAQERLALDTDTLQLAEKAFALGETDLTALLRA
ncbi:MAG: TolC family protein, partial [Comamonas sp.]|nr:TolC family protein [Comamonas sp.]